MGNILFMKTVYCLLHVWGYASV